MCKKRIVLLIFLFVAIIELYAEPYYLQKKYYHTDEPASVCIMKNQIEFNNEVEPGVLKISYIYDSFKGRDNNYIILNCLISNSYFLYLVKNDNDTKYTYGSWEITYGYTEKESPYDRAKLVPFMVKKADSYIIEKDQKGNEIKFFPENSNLFDLESNPWAIKKDSTKIIYLSTERFRNSNITYNPISDMVFVNGFVHPGKEYLYEQNARARKIQITYDDKTFTTELKDTGNFQVVHLPYNIMPSSNNEVKLEILDCYNGTKYTDVVISGIYYLDAVLKE